MKYLLTIALCLALVFGVGAQRRIIAQQTTTTEETTTTTESTVDKTSKLKKKSASALIAAVQKADLYVYKVSKKNSQLNSKKKGQRPYWLGLKTINTKTKGMKKALTAKDKSFFKLLSETGLAVTDVKTGVNLLAVKDKDVLRGVKALTIAYNELYRNYGKEAARKKKGGNLTKKETEQLTKMETEAKTVETKLKTMRKKVAV